MSIQIQNMETYCQNMENLDSKGKGVPLFCTGIIYGNNAGILTEDLTSNEQNDLEHSLDSPPYGTVYEKGKPPREVYIDVDALFNRIPNIELKYFADKSVIKL